MKFFFLFVFVNVSNKIDILRRHTDHLSVGKGLKLLDMILSLLWLLKTQICYKTIFFFFVFFFFFAHNVMLCNSVTFRFWATLELFRRHNNHEPKRFEIDIEYKSNDRTLQFHYQ